MNFLVLTKMFVKNRHSTVCTYDDGLIGCKRLNSFNDQVLFYRARAQGTESTKLQYYGAVRLHSKRERRGGSREGRGRVLTAL